MEGKYRVFLTVLFLEILFLLMLFMHAVSSVNRRETEISHKRSLAEELMLTDLAVWTEARYTRHPSQADWFSPFQDYPSSIEHFPAGSIITPSALTGGEEW